MFANLQQWPQGEPVVECSLTSGESIDLHNCADLRAVVLSPPGTLTLRFFILQEYVFDSRLRPFDQFKLTFKGVTDLRILQSPDITPEDEGLFEHLVFWRESEEIGKVQIVTEAAEIFLHFETVEASLHKDES